jgi:alpha-L-rhamnosidase
VLTQLNAGSGSTYASDYQYYTNLANIIRTNFFYWQNILQISTNASGYITNIGNGAQGDFALALYYNMVPDTQRISCVQALLTNAHNGILHYNDGYTATTDNTKHVSGGIQSCGRTLLELSRAGYTDIAYGLVCDLRFPAWLYSVTNGAPGVFQETTISERWNSYLSGPNTPGLSYNDHGYVHAGGGDSFNHYAFGCVAEWVWRNVVGINPNDLYPGYKNVILSPQIGGDLTYALGSFSSIRGPIACSWTTNSTTNSFTFTVPANTTAYAFVPSTNIAHITESGTPSTNASGVLSYQVTNGSALFRLGSGTYNFTNWP